MNKPFIIRSLTAIGVMELITVIIRFVSGTTAQEYVATNPPLLLQVHHMFWSLPFIVAALLLRKRRNAAMWCWVITIGLIGSDLAHHFIVLPLWVGNTGWHWP